MVEGLCLSCPNFISTTFAVCVPTVNLELGPTNFSDLEEDIKPWLS